MFNFCPHCSKPIGQEQVAGKVVNCRFCGKPIGTVGAVAIEMGTVVTQRQAVDQNEVLIQRGVAARCPLCQQVVEVKGSAAKSFVPHFLKAERKMCRNSGKPVSS